MSVSILCVGKLKEKFYISAAEEYKKRLSGYCRFTLMELSEVRLPDNPSPAEIRQTSTCFGMLFATVYY